MYLDSSSEWGEQLLRLRTKRHVAGGDGHDLSRLLAVPHGSLFTTEKVNVRVISRLVTVINQQLHYTTITY